jgi:hypothetical protein
MASLNYLGSLPARGGRKYADTTAKWQAMLALAVFSENLWNWVLEEALKGRVCSLCEVISHAGAGEGHLDFFG